MLSLNLIFKTAEKTKGREEKVITIFCILHEMVKPDILMLFSERF